MPKISILVLLIEIYTKGIGIEFGNILSENIYYNNVELKNLLLISSFLSLILGTLVGLAQTRIKRLLA
jgi:NADH-ubiquinone oxidoreductase chain 2